MVGDGSSIALSRPKIKGARHRVTGSRELLETKENENAELRRQLAEQEHLLAESMHRILNGLQLAASFLRQQEKQIESEAAKVALRDASLRIDGIVRFQKQIGMQDGSSVDFAGYLTTAALDAGKTTGLACSVIAGSVITDGHMALDLAIIVNELIINAAKHAYPDGNGGEVEIHCLRDGDGKLCLTVRDQGPGFPADGNQPRASALGLRLIESIVAQRGGALKMENDGGACLTITIPARHAPH